MSTKGRRKRHQQTHVGAVRHHFHVRGRSAARDDRMGTGNDPMSDDAIGMQASDLIGREGCEGRGPRESPRSRTNAGRGPRPPEGAAVDDRPRHDPLVGGERSVGASGGDHVHLVPLSREPLRLRTNEVPCGVRSVGGIGRGDDGDAHGRRAWFNGRGMQGWTKDPDRRHRSWPRIPQRTADGFVARPKSSAPRCFGSRFS